MSVNLSTQFCANRQLAELPCSAKENASRSQKICLERFSEQGYDPLKDDMFLLLDREIAKNTVALPLEKPWNKTDLIVFKDDYRGALPLNGIRYSHFLKVKKVYADLFKGKTKIKIPNNYSLHKVLKPTFAILLSRKLGRQLINALKDHHKPITIISSNMDNCWAKNSRHAHIVGIGKRFFTRMNRYKFISFQGNSKRLASLPFFVTFAHELMHVYCRHDRKTSSKPSTISPLFGNMSEQEVISGCENIKIFNASCTKVSYNIFNENVLRSVFSLPIRIGHVGTVVGKFNPAAEFLIEYALWHDLEVHLKTRPGSESSVESIVRREFDNMSKFHLQSLEKVLFSAKGWTLIDLFVFYRNPHMLEKLLKEQPNLNNSFGSRLIELAMQSNFHPLSTGQILELLLNAGAIPNSINQEGMTPLHLAIRSNLIESVKVLLRYINPNLTMYNGDTACHLAMRCGNKEVIQLILPHITDFHAKGENGQTLMHALFRNNHFCFTEFESAKKVISVFQREGLRKDSVDSQGKTCFDIAVEEDLPYDRFFET